MSVKHEGIYINFSNNISSQDIFPQGNCFKRPHFHSRHIWILSSPLNNFPCYECENKCKLKTCEIGGVHPRNPSNRSKLL